MRNTTRSDYGNRLVAARKQAGLTQHALAKAVGMSQSALAEAETTGQGSAYTPQLASQCRVSAEWLATGHGEMRSARIWPFALLTPEQLHELPPQHLETVEKVALDLWRLSKVPIPFADTHPDTVQRKNGLTGSIPKPDFMKGESEQRSQSQRASRKTRNG
jgi:transcriptional regulator with XRE-family HTH domain